MPFYLLAWNPSRWRWHDINAQLKELARNGSFTYEWSCGNTKNIEPGSRCFLIRLGEAGRGIVGGGVALSAPREGAHWDADRARHGARSMHLDVRFEFLRHEPVVHWAELNSPPFNSFRWAIQKSGIRVPDELGAKLQKRASLRIREGASIPEELGSIRGFAEGGKKQITVNAYERNPQARAACIAHFGAQCSVCGFVFGRRYGDVAAGFIHVHHLNPIAATSVRYRVDPVRDLRPICPNCHAVVHLEDPPMPIERVRKLVRIKG